MNKNLRYGILLAGILITVGIMIVSVTTPVIYTPEKDTFSSPFHNNTDVLRHQSLNSTTDMLPLMQDLLDYTGPIVLNVRIQDIDQARRDLESFSKNRVALKNLVVNLDMTEGEIEEYSKSLALQEKMLNDLVNSSEVLDQLTSLEIQYRNDKDPTRLISVQLEGEDLRKKIRDLYAPYETETQKTVAFGKKEGLDTTSAEQSVVAFQRYVQEIDAGGQTPLVLPPNLLTLLLIPERGRYGDTVDCTGYLVSPGNNRTTDISRHNVTISLDDTLVSSSVTDDSGRYSGQIIIEKISSGTHPIQAASGPLVSETRLLTVIMVDSATSLSVGRVNSQGGVTLSGKVIANRAVRLAPVQLVWDSTNVAETMTDEQGQFKTVLQLPQGKHTVFARFNGEGYPINPSESKPYTVDVSMLQTGIPVDFSWLVLPGIIFAIVAAFLTGAFYYLRRSAFTRLFRSRIPQTGVPEMFGTDPDDYDRYLSLTEDAEQTLPGDDTGHPSGSLFSRYLSICKGSGLSEAAYTIYREFSRSIARDLKVARYMSMTPYELSRGCREKPYCRAFSRFVAIYERVRYGGYHSPAVQRKFEKELRKTELTLGREEH